MESPAAGGRSLPPWNNPHILTEAGLRDAQEYFFQTHARNSRLIAEGRSAQGLMKGRTRRRLSKEMGEDFKMYTGSSIGETPSSEESKGIRGELNEILESVFIRVAPNQTITSPIHEDVTILSHPLGAMEAVFNTACFYTALQSKYASLASDRRKVLKSVLDEELFKWVWRMFYALVLSDPSKPPDFNDKISSTGVRCVPVEKQQFSSIQKIIEIGIFLLGTSFAQSHLRYPLCFYFVNFLRQIQFRTLPAVDRRMLDAIFTAMHNRKPDEQIEDVLTAIDFLMNTKGSSMHAFDDVLGDEDSTAPKFVPGSELEFIDGCQEFIGSRFPESMAKYVPKASRSEASSDEGGSMIPLLFLMRTLPYPVNERILQALSGPLLSMVRNRLAHGGGDDVSKVLLDRVDEMVGQRQKRGESYTITSTVKGGTRTLSGDLSPAAGGKLKQQPAQGDSSPPEAPKTEPPAPKPKAAGQERVGASGTIMRERLIVSWSADNGGLRVATIAPAEIIELVGMDVRFLVPWVLFAVKSGQVIRIPPEKLTKEVLERILKAMLKGGANPREARLSAEERQQLYQGSKGKSANRLLLEMMEKHKVGATEPARAGTLSRAIGSLIDKLGDQLTSFVTNPMQEEHRQVAGQLSEEEKLAVGVLNKVARA